MAFADAPETAQGEDGTQATLVLKQLLGAGFFVPAVPDRV
jgi:hypothetical protein